MSKEDMDVLDEMFRSMDETIARMKVRMAEIDRRLGIENESGL